MARPSNVVWTLLVVLCFIKAGAAFQVGPKPSSRPGLIVKLKSNLAPGTAAGMSSLRPLASDLNLFSFVITDGKTAEEKAAELRKLRSVAYAVPDEWVRLAVGGAQHVPHTVHTPPPKPRKPSFRLRPRPAQRKPSYLPQQKTQPLLLRHPPLGRPPPLLPKPHPPPPRHRPLPPRPHPPLPRHRAPPPRHRAPPPKPHPLQPRPHPPPPKHRPLPPRPHPPLPRPLPPPPKPQPLLLQNQLPLTAKFPNDEFYTHQWGLSRIRAPQAWLHIRASTTVYTCIVDTGVKYDHPDLTASLVPMPAEWQTKNTDDNGHGTHVAGIIGAVGNDKIGVTGVSWRASILACKALDSSGWGLISKVIECIQWCRSQGARVINTSFEMDRENIPLKEAIGDGTKAGVFFAGAAGNMQLYGNNNDLSNRYPGGYNFSGNVAVANMNAALEINYNSNYGATTVHLAAPGTSILSTWPGREYAGGYYAIRNGTSMAAPYVSGAAALAIAASNGSLSNAQVADLLIKTSTPITALQGKVIANGLINLEKLVVQAIQTGKAAAVAAAQATKNGTVAAAEPAQATINGTVASPAPAQAQMLAKSGR